MAGQTASYRDLLRVRNVARLLAAAMLGRMGDRILILAMILYALDQYHSAPFAGWLSFAIFAPGLAASPLAGALLDRVGSIRAIRADMLASTALVGAMAVAGWTGTATPPVLLGLTAAFSVTNPLSAAGVRSLLPSLVPASALARVSGMDMAVHAVVEVVGPAVGGVLITFAGAPATFLVVAVLYLAAALCLFALPRPAIGSGATISLAPILGEAWSSIGFVMRDPTLRSLAACYALYQAAWGIMLVAMPIGVARALPGGGELVTSAIWAVSGVFGGAGALLAGALGGDNRERQLIIAGLLATAIAIYPTCVLGLPGLALGWSAMCFISGSIDVGVLTLRQRRIPPAYLGRALAVSMSLNMSGLPIGSALGGLLAEVDDHAPIMLAACAAALAGLVCYVMVPANGQDAG